MARGPFDLPLPLSASKDPPKPPGEPCSSWTPDVDLPEATQIFRNPHTWTGGPLDDADVLLLRLRRDQRGAPLPQAPPPRLLLVGGRVATAPSRRNSVLEVLAKDGSDASTSTATAAAAG